MSVRQISVFIENKQGRLIAVTGCLAANNINIRALSVADTSDFGILRLIVDDPSKAYQSLKECGFTVRETEVLAMEVPDVPGGINKGLTALDNAGINVEYIYAFFGTNKETALNIIKVDKMDLAKDALKESGIQLLNPEEVYSR